MTSGPTAPAVAGVSLAGLSDALPSPLVLAAAAFGVLLWMISETIDEEGSTEGHGWLASLLYLRQFVRFAFAASTVLVGLALLWPLYLAIAVLALLAMGLLAYGLRPGLVRAIASGLLRDAFVGKVFFIVLLAAPLPCFVMRALNDPAAAPTMWALTLMTVSAIWLTVGFWPVF